MLLISGHFEMLKPAVVRGLAVPSELVLSALIENRYIDTYMIITEDWKLITRSHPRLEIDKQQ